MIGTIANVIGAALATLSIVAGVAAGVWLAKRVEVPPLVAAGAPKNPLVYKLATWWLRMLIVLVSMVMVSAPVVFLLSALLG